MSLFPRRYQVIFVKWIGRKKSVISSGTIIETNLARLVSTIVIIYGTNICCCHFVTHSTQLNPSTTSNHHSSLKHINEQMIQPNYKRRQHNLYVESKRTTNGTYVHINTTTPLVRFTSKCYSNSNNNTGDNKGKPNEPKMTPKADTLNWYLNLFMDSPCVCVFF